MLFQRFFYNFGDVGIWFFSAKCGYCVRVVFLAPIIAYTIAIMATVKGSSLHNLTVVAANYEDCVKLIGQGFCLIREYTQIA